jgi:hypothetical protein
MTATATIYTPFGFAIAADGNQLWEDRLSRDVAVREYESDRVQKIFEIKTKHAALAYIIRGHVANRDRSFDIAKEVQAQSARFDMEGTTSCEQLLQSLATKLELAIDMAVQARRLEEPPATQIDFAGYFKHVPCWMELQFHPFYNPRSRRLYEIHSRALYPGACFVSGSLVVGDLISRSDPRFEQFCARFDPTNSLRDAAGFVNGYIEACCSPTPPSS